MSTGTAAGAQSANLPPPTLPAPVNCEAFQKAIQEYTTTLSNEDKDAFKEAPDIIEHLKTMQLNRKRLISDSLTSRVANVLQCIRTFMSSLTIFIGHHPEMSSLVVGGVNCILVVGTSYIVVNTGSNSLGLGLIY